MPTYKPDYRHEELGSGASADALQRAESALGYTLPEPYRLFLSELDGVAYSCEHQGESVQAYCLSFSQLRRPEGVVPTAGTIDREEFEEMLAEVEPVSELFGIDDEFFSRARRDPERDMYFSCVPKHIWPIGSNYSGDYVCISLAGEHVGRIYSWPRLNDGLDHSYEEASMRWVADDFDSFWNAVDLMTDDQLDLLIG